MNQFDLLSSFYLAMNSLIYILNYFILFSFASFYLLHFIFLYFNNRFINLFNNIFYLFK